MGSKYWTIPVVAVHVAVAGTVGSGVKMENNSRLEKGLFPRSAIFEKRRAVDVADVNLSIKQRQAF